jgi:hypothetical protein
MEYQEASEVAFDGADTDHIQVEEDIVTVDRHTEIVEGNDLVEVERKIDPFAGLVASVLPASDAVEPVLGEA